MTSVSGIVRILTPVFAAALFISGCAKTPPIAGPAAPADVAAKHQDDRKPEEKAKTAAEGGQVAATDVVVAKANGVELRMDALIKMMNRLAPQEGAAEESLEEHKKRSLDKLILQELAYQQAKAKGLSIRADKIDMAIDNLRKNVGGEKEYAEYLAKMNVTEADLRAQVERSLLVELNYAREVLAKITVPEEEVRQEYEKQKHLYIIPEKASIIDVYVLQRGDTGAEARKAQELLRTINRDRQKDPWNLTLDGTFIVRDIAVNAGSEKELFAAAKKLKPNQLSGVVETPSGNHIIRLDTYSPARQLTFDEVRDRIELKFKVPAQEKRMEEWERELKKDAKIEILLDTAAKQQENTSGSRQAVPQR